MIPATIPPIAPEDNPCFDWPGAKAWDCKGDIGVDVDCELPILDCIALVVLLAFAVLLVLVVLAAGMA